MGLVANGKGSQAGVCGSWKRNGACPKINDCPHLHPDDQKGKGKGKAKGKNKGKGKGKVKRKEKKMEKKEKATSGLLWLTTSTDGQKIKEVKVPKAKLKARTKVKAKEKVKERVKAKRGEANDHNPRLAQQNATIGTQIHASLAIPAIMITRRTAKIGSPDGVSGTKNADLDTNKV